MVGIRSEVVSERNLPTSLYIVHIRTLFQKRKLIATVKHCGANVTDC